MKAQYPFDMIVILGAAVWPNEQPSPSLKRRACHAAKLYKANKAPIIIGSGGTGKYAPSEAEMIKRICLTQGVQADAIILEDKSKTTLENVSFSSQILKAKGAKSILVVTDKYHLPRALMCFRFFNFKCEGSGPQRGKSDTPLYKWIWYHIREIAALPYYYLKLRRL